MPKNVSQILCIQFDSRCTYYSYFILEREESYCENLADFNEDIAEEEQLHFSITGLVVVV